MKKYVMRLNILARLLGGEAGERFRRRVKWAAKERPWYWGLINLAWTAGPVTYLALQGGYYIGYGSFAPPKIFIYFAGYTVIAGIFAGIVQFFRVTVIEPKRKLEEQDIAKAADQLFMIYFSARNAYLRSYPEEDQPVVAAWWSCRSAATDVDVLEEAVRDVTGNDELAHAIKRVEFYRRQGFVDLVKREYEAYAPQITKLKQDLEVKFPDLAKRIEDRFRGNTPTVWDGQPRPAGFIERLMAADEQGRPELATPDDALAMIIFSLEMLLGRVVLTLYPEFYGHKRLEEAKEKLDALLSDFRLLLRERNGRMAALIMDISQSDPDEELVYSVGATSEQLQDMLLQVLQKHEDVTFGQRRYQAIIQLNSKLHKLWDRLISQEKAYNRIWEKDGPALRKRFQAFDMQSKRPGALNIEEHEISLGYKEKVLFARRVLAILDNVNVREKSLRGVFDKGSSAELLKSEDYLKLTVQMLNGLDELMNISEPEEQLAIEASREPDFGCVEPGLATQTKVMWGRTMVEEVQQDRTSSAHRLASSLVRYLNVPLGHDIIRYLVTEYAASEEYLAQLDANESHHVEVASHYYQKDLLRLPKWSELKKGC